MFALGYKANEVMELQPQEIATILEGAELAEEIENRRAAYFTAWLIAPHVKKGKVSMDKILKPLLKRKKQTTDQLKSEKELLLRALNGEK